MWKWTSGLLALGLAALTAGTLFAHGGTPLGPYVFEYGWEAEPPIVGQATRINLIVSSSLPGGPPRSLEGLTTELHFEEEEIPITFQPAIVNLPGLFFAEYTPERTGQYALHLSGELESQPVEVELYLDPVLSPMAAWLIDTFGRNWPYYLGGLGAVLAAVFVFLRRKR